jgi:hypothetical protein
MARNLVIERARIEDDIAAASDADAFGPFAVSGHMVSGKLSHPGIQTVGWILQWVLPVPPNDPPCQGP